MRSTNFKISLTPVAVVASLVAVAGGGYFLRAYQPPVTQVVAYTLTQNDSGTMISPKAPGMSRTVVTAVRADGSRVKAVLGAMDKSSSVFDSRRITLPAAGREMVVSDKIGAVSTEYFPARTQATTSAPQLPASCQPKAATPMRYLGSEQILGYQTYKYEQTFPYEGGKTIDATFWYAPSFHCAAIKTTSILSNGATVIERNDVVPVSISVGEPDPSLFQVAANYRELPPSARQTEAAAQNGVTTVPDAARQTMQMLDSRYYASRAGQP